jgi:hypothetical protein
MTAATKPQQHDTLMDLLYSAPDEQVGNVQDAIRHVAAGDFRAAAQSLQFAADWYDDGNSWADRAERTAAHLRAKAPAI